MSCRDACGRHMCEPAPLGGFRRGAEKYATCVVAIMGIVHLQVLILCCCVRAMWALLPALRYAGRVGRASARMSES